MGDFRDLMAYRKAFELAMEIYRISAGFPKEERYSLTDQIRRSSRSVCASIAEGYRKRHYRQAFLYKLSESDAENAETQVWLDFAAACGYVPDAACGMLKQECESVGKLLQTMINHPEKFGG